MKIKFLGTGGAFDFEKGNASAVVQLKDKKILIDCGFSTLGELVEKNVAKDIDYILLTHLHGDHVGSLPTLLPYFQYKLGKAVPKIIIPNQKFQTEVFSFLTGTYENERANFAPITDFPEIGWIDTTNMHKPGMTSFAYYFTDGEELIYYSGDIGNADVAADFLRNREEPSITVFHETTPKLDVAVHASYQEVQEKLGQYNTFVYHIDKKDMPNDCTLQYVEDFPELLY